jgi:hypothetical protein
MISRLALMMGAVAALATSATACPSCSTGQGLETLIYVLCFLITPYIVVSGVMFSVRRLFNQERGL